MALVKSFNVPAASAVGVFQQLGIAAAAAKSYYLLIYSSPSAGLQLADSAFASDPEAVMPQTFPMLIDSAQYATAVTDDIYLFNASAVQVPVTVFAQLR